MSSEATRWVTRAKRDVPSSLRYTLLVMATYAAKDGRGMWPSAKTLAEDSGKSERQIRKDLAELQEQGHITRGDQKLVAHLKPTERPIVYDLAGMADSTQNVIDIGRRVGRQAPVIHDRGGDVMDDRGGDVTHDRNPLSPTTPKTLPKGRETPAPPLRGGRAGRGNVKSTASLAPSAQPLSTWCGRCDSPHTRRHIDDNGNPAGACPTCSTASAPAA